MAKDWRALDHVIAVSLSIACLMLSGCGRPSKTTPPNSVLSALKNVREGYDKEDMDLFCKDFSDIMFTQGFTKQAYLDVVQGLKRKLGEWKSEAYLGEDNGVHTWRAEFTNGKAELVLVLNNDSRVTGLWFR